MSASKPIESRDTSIDEVTLARFSDHYLFSDSDFLLARARAVTAARAMPYLSEFSLNTGTYFLLALSCSEASPTITELSQILLISDAEAELLVDELERLFLIARRPDARNKNGVVVKATPQGEELFATAREALTAMEHDPMQQLSLAERKQLADLLGRIAF
jgi:DNA-binding MarR family transcriptional regulator